MSDLDDDEFVQPATSGIPILTGSDGQPYIGCDSAIAILRAIAEVANRLDDDPQILAAAIHIDADNLQARAIAATTRAVT